MTDKIKNFKDLKNEFEKTYNQTMNTINRLFLEKNVYDLIAEKIKSYDDARNNIVKCSTLGFIENGHKELALVFASDAPPCVVALDDDLIEREIGIVELLSISIADVEILVNLSRDLDTIINFAVDGLLYIEKDEKLKDMELINELIEKSDYVKSRAKLNIDVKMKQLSEKIKKNKTLTKSLKSEIWEDDFLPLYLGRITKNDYDGFYYMLSVSKELNVLFSCEKLGSYYKWEYAISDIIEYITPKQLKKLYEVLDGLLNRVDDAKRIAELRG